MQMNELQKELDRAKVALMQTKDAVFFTTIVFSLKFKWDDTCSTAYTDGHVLGFNPDFFLKASKGKRVFVLVHEACHVAYDHMGRLKGRDMRLWNKAADHVINLILKARGFEMWDWVLCDPRFTDMSTEQVYDILKAEQCAAPNPMEDIRPAGSGDAAQPTPTDEEHQRHIQDIVARAVMQSKIQGEPAGAVPSEIELFLQKLQRPKLPWQQILKREVGGHAKTGYSWMRPNRRYYPDHYLPSRWGTAPSELDFYVDISGSVTDWQFSVFMSEIAGTLKMFNLKQIRVIQFDRHIKSVDVVHNLTQLSKIKFHGRGSTDLEEVFDDIEKREPQLALIFTDGGFHWRRNKLKGRVIWLINDNPRFVAKFGKVIHFKTE